LDSIPEKYNKIVFYASIYQGQSRGQQLGELQNAFIRAVDGNGKEIAKYNISGDKSLTGHRSFIFAEAVRNGSDWDFVAVGEAHKTDSYSKIAESYKNGTPGTSSDESAPRKKLFGLF
jgi:tellurium resistance protein TerD